MNKEKLLNEFHLKFQHYLTQADRLMSLREINDSAENVAWKLFLADKRKDL